jgi:transposase-like protein
VIGHAPERITTYGPDSYPHVIDETLANEIIHRCNHWLNNRLEQDHRDIKERYYPMCGFGNVELEARFCRIFDALRDYLRPCHMKGGNGLMSTTPTAVQRATC